MSSIRTTSSVQWSTKYVYAQATVCLLLGMACGYLLRGASAASAATANLPGRVEQQVAIPAASQITQEHLQRMGDSEAAPLLAQLRKTPDDPELLAKAGMVYYAAHDFRQSAAYYERSLAIRDDIATRIEIGRAYFYAGDPDRALAQFEHVVTVEPGNANALYNVGMIRWKNNGDIEGAIAAWKQLLKTNPKHPRRAEVERLIATAREQEKQ